MPVRGVSRSFYVDDELLETVERLVKAGYARNVSQFVNDALRDVVVKHTDDKEFMSKRMYDRDKRRQIFLAKECRSLLKFIQSCEQVYDELYALASECGLDFVTFENLDVVVPAMLKKWTGSKESLQIFITLLELVKEKVEIEQRLEKYRVNFSFKRDGKRDVESEAYATAHSVQGAGSVSKMRKHNSPQNP